MDPNTARAQARVAAEDLLRDNDRGLLMGDACQQEAVALAEAFIALDDWIQRGGVLPRSWGGERR